MAFEKNTELTQRLTTQHFTGKPIERNRSRATENLILRD